MKPKYILSCLAAVLLSAAAASAQTTLAKWTFEASQPAGTPGAGVWITNIAAEVGSGTASGWHSGFGTPAYSTPAGNGSSHSFSANGWTNNPAATSGDLFQFAVNTVGFNSIVVSWDQFGSGTGPKNFNFFYSTDGVNFTQFGSTYSVLSAPTWSAGSSTTLTSYTNDLTSITALNNAPVVYFRLVVVGNTSISGGTIGTAGTDRIDNFTVAGSSLSSAPSIVSQPFGTNLYKGDTFTLSVTAGGNAPLSYQWYYTNSSGLPFVALADGPSGYGFGSITNSTNAILRITYLDPAQSGGYEVIVTNLSGSITSQVATLNVGIRAPIVTNIAYMRTLQDPVTWKPIDITNVYSFTGIVTSPYNISTSANVEEFYVQDGTGCGVSVDFFNDTTPVNLGDIVQVTAPLGQFDGLLQVSGDLHNPANAISTISTGNPLPAPKIFDIGSLTNIPFVETNVEGSLIVVNNVFFQSIPQFISGSDINMTNVNKKVLQLFVNANSDLVAASVPVFATSVTGVLGQFTTSTPATSGYELDVFNYADIIPGTMANIPFTIQTIGTNAVVTWNGTLFGLQSSTNVAGPYVTISGATSPYTNAYTTNSLNFYRLVH